MRIQENGIHGSLCQRLFSKCTSWKVHFSFETTGKVALWWESLTMKLTTLLMRSIMLQT